VDVVALAPGLYQLPFPVGHVYLSEDDDGLTLVDAGVAGSGPAIAAAIRGLGRRPEEVRRLFLTHFHRDHVGSAAEIAGWGDVTVLAHAADAPVIRGEAAGPEPDFLDWERELHARVASTMPAAEPAPVRVDAELGDGDELPVGGGARVVAVPGHTPGSAALHVTRPKALFTGDTIARAPDGRVILGVFNADRAQALESFRRQAALDVEIAGFGHGEPLLGGASDRLRAAVAVRPAG
jgi:glyoxylase-like metal-dependent hydrolase (beta-lactamase superfamily II)